MRFSTRTRYGARAMVELAAAYPDRAVSVRQMAQNQRLSAKYLEHIVSALKAAGLIEAVRGMHGGYVLSRPPEEIDLSEIFHVLDGYPSPVDCVEDPDRCPMRGVCPTRDTWVQVAEAIEGILGSTTLRDLLGRSRDKGESGALM
jgi:Rrf2 family protein